MWGGDSLTNFRTGTEKVWRKWNFLQGQKCWWASFFFNSPFIQLAQHWWAPFLSLFTKLVNIMDPTHVFPCGLTPSPLPSTSHSTPSSVCLQLCQRLSKTAHTVGSSRGHQQLLWGLAASYGGPVPCITTLVAVVMRVAMRLSVSQAGGQYSPTACLQSHDWVSQTARQIKMEKQCSKV